MTSLRKSGETPELLFCCMKCYTRIIVSSQLTNALYRTETHVDNGALFFVAIYAYERGTMGVFLAVQTINLEKEKEKEKEKET